MTAIETKRSRLGAIQRSTSGNLLERFGFLLFGVYATSVSKAFFPTDDEVTSLEPPFATFQPGALMRQTGDRAAPAGWSMWAAAWSLAAVLILFRKGNPKGYQS